MVKRKFDRRGITVDAVSYQHLKGRIDCEAVLEQLGIDIGFRQGPTQIMCHCPDLQGNHSNGDATPSFGFSEEKLVYNCFQCGGGNIIELVQMMRPEYTQRFPNDYQKDQEALSWLEQFADFNLEIDLPGRIQAILNPTIEQKQEMPEYPDSLLFKFQKIHPYLYERGLTKDIITEMHVGFDDEHCGIIIPHYFQGVLRGWQTRHLAEEPRGVYHCEVHSCNFKNDKSIRVPKYKNTTNFPKLNTLYGYDRLKQYLKEEDGKSVILVESPMTALKLMSMGFNRVVATFGQFSKEQGMLLIAAPLVYFWPDNDKAGETNTTNAISSLGKYTSLRIVPVIDKPKGDAADLASKEEVLRYLEAAYPASLWPLWGLCTYEDLQREELHQGGVS